MIRDVLFKLFHKSIWHTTSIELVAFSFSMKTETFKQFTGFDIFKDTTRFPFICFGLLENLSCRPPPTHVSPVCLNKTQRKQRKKEDVRRPNLICNQAWLE